MPKEAKTEADALTAALQWAAQEPSEHQLHHVTFGRYADGSGCYWVLQFLRSVDNGVIENRGQDTVEPRFRRIIRTWMHDLGMSTGKPDSDQE